MPVKEVSLVKSAGLREGHAIVKVVDGVPVLLARRGGRVYAYVAVCPHKFYALCSGPLEGGLIACPGHGERFRVEDGSPSRGIAPRPLTRVEAFERDGRVFVRADFEALAASLAAETRKE